MPKLSGAALRLFQNEQNAQRRPVDGANSRGVGRISRASLEAIPQCAVKDEIADVFAWLVGAWHLAVPNASIDRELAIYYEHGCPVCGQDPCSCEPFSGRAQNLFDVGKLGQINVRPSSCEPRKILCRISP